MPPYILSVWHVCGEASIDGGELNVVAALAGVETVRVITPVLGGKGGGRGEGRGRGGEGEGRGRGGGTIIRNEE
jgi:hypothetical protein